MLTYVEPRTPVLSLRGRSHPLSRVSSGGFLPVLLVMAVLLCDGILGFAHQISCEACGPTQVPGIHHGSAAGIGETANHHTGDDASSGFLEDHSYAAVALAATGTALLVLLLRVRKWREASVLRSVFRQPYSPYIPHRPRGPTLPSLQVLRL